MDIRENGNVDHLNMDSSELPSTETNQAPSPGGLKNRLIGLKNAKWLKIIGGIVVVCAIVLPGVFILRPVQIPNPFSSLFGPKPTPTPYNIWTPAKPQSAPLAHGKQLYRVSGSTQGAPRIVEASVDPIDPARGATQTWTLHILEPNGKSVKEVSVKVFTDKKQTIVDLNKSSGTDQDGIWEGSSVIDDSYDEQYQAWLDAKNDAGLSQSVVLTFR